MRKIREEELQALTLLKKYFYEYRELVLSDKPDLVDMENSIGVEITTAVNQNVAEREAFYRNKMNDKNIRGFSKVDIQKFEQYGLSLVHEKGNGRIFGLSRMFGTEEKELIFKAIEKKYKKQYQPLKILDLYIFFRQFFIEGISKDDLQGLFQNIHQYENIYGKIFDKIMIDFYSELLILDVNNDSVRVITNYNE
ncbi:MAG: hypothetical protein E7355_04085 [Clostridiales bacterium]|nr:hypothetical protein [Clostridiales bacterium]